MASVKLGFGGIEAWLGVDIFRWGAEGNLGLKVGRWFLLDLHRVGGGAVHCVARLPWIGEAGWSRVCGRTWENWRTIRGRELRWAEATAWDDSQSGSGVHGEALG